MALQELMGDGVNGLITALAADHVKEECNTERELVPIRRMYTLISLYLTQ